MKFEYYGRVVGKRVLGGSGGTSFGPLACCRWMRVIKEFADGAGRRGTGSDL